MALTEILSLRERFTTAVLRNVLWHCGTAACLAFALSMLIKWGYLRKTMPPGPLGVPWIGNGHELPAVMPWRKFAEWNNLYGPVVSIFLGSTPVIREILSDNKRGLLLPNNEHWRKWRKLLHSGFNSRKAETYREIQSLESTVLIHQILQDPWHYERHLQRFAASVVTAVTYGRRVDSVDEWVVKENMEAVNYLTSVNIPGKYLVESWPWLLKLPHSIQWFRREPEARRQRDTEFLMHLLNDVKGRMTSGAIPDCLAAKAIANKDQIGMTDLEIAYSVSSPFGAGIETTAGTLATFILSMLHFPEVMKKAQRELDDVVGPDRMPEFNDKDHLPYINALINETLRWRPVPILGGTPHAVTKDDEYNGGFIPKGSIIYANFFGIMQDPVMFPSPDTFRPERFLDTSDPRMQVFELPFGFGRRICPGMYLVLNSLFINVARILWAFDILPTLNEHAQEIIPDSWNFTHGFNIRPVSFECRFVPRSDKIVGSIKEQFEAGEKQLINWQ